jgi:hypothetical protein
MFWVVWLISGAAAASVWLETVCPPAACSFILVMLQAPSFFLGALCWLLFGIISTLAIVWFVPQRSPAIPSEGKYFDEQDIRLGDVVRIGKAEKTEGVVVHIPARGQVRKGYDPSNMPPITFGFVVCTESGELHHFLVANPFVMLVARAGTQVPNS